MDRLFLLHPNFEDDTIDATGTLYYCPHCAFIEGILTYYPELKERIELIYVDFKRPRTGIIELIGEENQGCPTLIIDSRTEDYAPKSYYKSYKGQLFINSSELIAKYLSETYGIGKLHP